MWLGFRPQRVMRAEPLRTWPNLQHQVTRLHTGCGHNVPQHTVIEHEVLAQGPAWRHTHEAPARLHTE